jgi:hypothetical protein
VSSVLSSSSSFSCSHPSGTVILAYIAALNQSATSFRKKTDFLYLYEIHYKKRFFISLYKWCVTSAFTENNPHNLIINRKDSLTKSMDPDPHRDFWLDPDPHKTNPDPITD